MAKTYPGNRRGKYRSQGALPEDWYVVRVRVVPYWSWGRRRPESPGVQAPRVPNHRHWCSKLCYLSSISSCPSSLSLSDHDRMDTILSQCELSVASVLGVADAIST